MSFEVLLVQKLKEDDEENWEATRDIHVGQGMQGFYPLDQDGLHIEILSLHLFLNDLKKLVEVELNVLVKRILY